MKKSANRVCSPRKPPKAEGKASKCLSILLSGGTINRKHLASLGVCPDNGSAHSLISLLRNGRYIPIKSTRERDGTATYTMLPAEIKRYKNPILREQQRKEMKALVDRKRQLRIAALIAKTKSGA